MISMGGVAARTSQRTQTGIVYNDVGYGWNAEALARLTTNETKR